jgi:hypothetical protein
VFIAIDFGRALFEPSIRHTTTIDALTEVADYFKFARVLEHEMNANVRLARREVRVTPMEAPAQGSQPESLNSGDLTPATLLSRIGEDIYKEVKSGDRPEPPSRTRARFTTDADAVVVRYRFAWWAYMTLLFTMVALAIVLAGTAALIDPPRLLTMTAPIMTMTLGDVEGFATSAPYAIGAGLLFAAFTGMYWILYVRRVRISRDSVQVWRGLKPIPRRYPRSPQSRILHMDRYVMLGEADRPRVVNPSLSPMLRTVAEAKWVAWEMRRAMDQTG